MNGTNPLPVGTLLLPGDYQIRNGNPISGLILETKNDIFGFNYYVRLSNGNIKWISEDVVRDLFEVVK